MLFQDSEYDKVNTVSTRNNGQKKHEQTPIKPNTNHMCKYMYVFSSILVLASRRSLKCVEIKLMNNLLT